MTDILFSILLAAVSIAVFGSFADLISAKEALLVLAVCAVPLTALGNIAD